MAISLTVYKVILRLKAAPERERQKESAVDRKRERKREKEREKEREGKKGRGGRDKKEDFGVLSDAEVSCLPFFRSWRSLRAHIQ